MNSKFPQERPDPVSIKPDAPPPPPPKSTEPVSGYRKIEPVPLEIKSFEPGEHEPKQVMRISANSQGRKHIDLECRINDEMVSVLKVYDDGTIQVSDKLSVDENADRVLQALQMCVMGNGLFNEKKIEKVIESYCRTFVGIPKLVPKELAPMMTKDIVNTILKR